jgi:hypothetical protein
MGKARQLRRELTAASNASRASLETILAPLRRGLNRRGSMRPEEIAGAMRAWRMSLPPVNRVSLSIQMQRGVAQIDELFLASSELSRPGWGLGEWEPGLCLASMSIRLGRCKVEMTERDLAAFSLHAVGRRFQRGASAADRSSAAVMRDLGALASLQAPDGLAAGSAIALPTGSGSGCWVGEAVSIDGKMTSLIRSFFHADMTL